MFKCCLISPIAECKKDWYGAVPHYRSITVRGLFAPNFCSLSYFSDLSALLHFELLEVLLKGLGNVASKSNGGPSLVMHVKPEGIVVTCIPPENKPGSQVHAVQFTFEDQGIGQTQSHGSVVRPLPWFQLKPIVDLSRIEWLFCEFTNEWVVLLFAIVHELTEMTPRVTNSHAKHAAQRPLIDLLQFLDIRLPSLRQFFLQSINIV